MKKTNLFNTRTAKAVGYRALTVGYRLPQEQHMLDNVIADLRRGNISHCLVKTHEGIAVWRSLRTATIACTQSIRSGTIACTQGPSGRPPLTTKAKAQTTGGKTRLVASGKSGVMPPHSKHGRRNATSLPTKGKRS